MTLTAEEIYSKVAAKIVEDGWSVITITKEAVRFDHNEYAPDVYWCETTIPDHHETIVDNPNWELINDFDPAEYLDTPGHVKYWFEEDIKSVLEDNVKLSLVCVAIQDDNDPENLVGWALVSKVSDV